jgi:glycosyltransferase involved in cell wall biosynthesis
VVTDGESALLVDHAVPAVASALVRLLSDERLRSRLAARARDRVREVAFLPRELERVEELYRELVARGPRAAAKRGQWLDLAGLLLR